MNQDIDLVFNVPLRPTIPLPVKTMRDSWCSYSLSETRMDLLWPMRNRLCFCLSTSIIYRFVQGSTIRLFKNTSLLCMYLSTISKYGADVYWYTYLFEFIKRQMWYCRPGIFFENHAIFRIWLIRVFENVQM